MFKVSVIIPVYNAERFVEKAVVSALNQEEVAEVILIEDGSPDNALLLCTRLAQAYTRVKLLQHPDKGNHGAAQSRNLGILNASCEYVAFLDADDFFLLDRFKADKLLFESNNFIEGIYSRCDATAIDEVGEKRILDSKLPVLTMNCRVDSKNLFENLSPIGSAGFFSLNGLTLKKNVFKKTGLMDERLRLSQDTDISIKLAAICQLFPGNLDSPVAMYGVHADNRSHDYGRLIANRPALFYNLYIWGRNKNLKTSRLFILWERFYEYYIIVSEPGRRRQVRLLMAEAVKNPSLLRSRFFLKQLPILSRILA